MFSHPLWLVGFRPFFTLAVVAAVVYPLLWALVFSGVLALPASGPSPTQWHAHEMLFGFGWAVLGGFLLTASKNWVSIRGLHGGPLALAALLWVVERFAIFLPADGALAPVRLALLNAFSVYVIGYVIVTLVRFRKKDDYPDNWYFVFGLPVFVVARNLLLANETWILGYTLSIGIFRLAFAVMFERTITQFMKVVMNAVLPRYRVLDHSIKALVLASAFQALMPANVAAVVLAAAGALLFVRFLLWKPHLGMRNFGIGLMYAGYLGLVIHFALWALALSGAYVGIGTLPLHAFTFLTMGTIIPAMLIRICQGHTGRKPLFTTSDRVAFGFMAAASFFRLVATQLWPAQYQAWIALSAIGWSLCFLIVGVRVVPFVWKPRVDGKEH